MQTHLPTSPLVSVAPDTKTTSNIISKADVLADSKPPSLWKVSKLSPPPPFYPLEKSTRLVDEPASAVAARLQDCFRQLSIFAQYTESRATLLTQEQVELECALWQHTENDGVLVEVQRRKGDSIAFHRYARSILDAAVLGGDASRSLLGAVHSKHVQRLLLPRPEHEEEHENAIRALEIAHGLLTKDRLDAQRLGLESFCLLTDATVTGVVTSVLAAHVVLLGSTQNVELPQSQLRTEFPEVRTTILELVQLHEPESDDSLHNLALSVLANALDVLEHAEERLNEQQPVARLRTSSSNDVAHEFGTTQQDVLKTLMGELAAAKQAPHNACLSARSLASLCRSSEQARLRLHEWGAKQVVQTALEVGCSTHLQLETQVRQVQEALQEEEE